MVFLHPAKLTSSALHGCLIGLVVATAAVGCSSSASASAPLSFPADAYVTTLSQSGALKIEVRTSPQPPARGDDSIELTITNASDGTPRDGLTIDVQPWMPSMNHGTSTPTIEPEGNGKYLVSGVYLFMPGTWELRTTLSGTLTGSQTTTDHAAPDFAVP